MGSTTSSLRGGGGGGGVGALGDGGGVGSGVLSPSALHSRLPVRGHSDIGLGGLAGSIGGSSSANYNVILIENVDRLRPTELIFTLDKLSTFMAAAPVTLVTLLVNFLDSKTV